DQLGHNLAQPLRTQRRGNVHRVHYVSEQHRHLLVLRWLSVACVAGVPHCLQNLPIASLSRHDKSASVGASLFPSTVAAVTRTDPEGGRQPWQQRLCCPRQGQLPDQSARRAWGQNGSPAKNVPPVAMMPIAASTLSRPW